MFESVVIIALIVPVIFLLFIFTWLMPLKLILEAISAKVMVQPIDLIGMRFRRVDPNAVVQAAIKLRQAGIELEEEKENKLIHLLEAHFIVMGNLDELVTGMIEARKHNANLSFNQAAAVDLGGGNICRVVLALEEAKKRNIELSVEKAITIELSISSQEQENSDR